jgi:tetratricopeptide (TPR) repeat protein
MTFPVMDTLFIIAVSDSKQGIALLGVKRYEQALAAFDQAISLHPNNAEAQSGKGDVLLIGSTFPPLGSKTVEHSRYLP